jgi:hypothetical protein
LELDLELARSCKWIIEKLKKGEALQQEKTLGLACRLSAKDRYELFKLMLAGT